MVLSHQTGVRIPVALSEDKDIREAADYGDFVEIIEEDTQIQLKNARKFTEKAERIMQRMIVKAKK